MYVSTKVKYVNVHSESTNNNDTNNTTNNTVTSNAKVFWLKSSLLHGANGVISTNAYHQQQRNDNLVDTATIEKMNVKLPWLCNCEPVRSCVHQ